MQHGGLRSFFALIEQHTTQTEPAYCGLATLVVVLNSMAVDPRRDWKKPWRFYHEDLLNCCQDLEEVKKVGITMEDFRCLAVCQGLRADVYHTDVDTVSIDDFRQAIREVCTDRLEDELTAMDANMESQTAGEALSQVLVVSYDRKTIGQTGSGHFAPIAAFDAISDTVLILDTARFKYGSHWVPVALLYEALKPIDTASGRSRGFVKLTKEDNSREIPSKESIGLLRLLETPLSEQVKADFLEFWRRSGKDVGWEDFRRYWTKGETERGFVWYLVNPVMKPCESDEKKAVQDALRQLRAYIEDRLGAPLAATGVSCLNGDCRPNFSRTIPLAPTETIFLLYLATREVEERDTILTSFSSAGKNMLAATLDSLQHNVFTVPDGRTYRRDGELSSA